jgi:hypothetical protein
MGLMQADQGVQSYSSLCRVRQWKYVCLQLLPKPACECVQLRRNRFVALLLLVVDSPVQVSRSVFGEVSAAVLSDYRCCCCVGAHCNIMGFFMFRNACLPLHAAAWKRQQCMAANCHICIAGHHCLVALLSCTSETVTLPPLLLLLHRETALCTVTALMLIRAQ